MNSIILKGEIIYIDISVMEKKDFISWKIICNQDFLGGRDSAESILIASFLTVQVLLLDTNALPKLKLSIVWINKCKTFVLLKACLK